MKIERFKKLPQGRYRLYLEKNHVYDFYEEIILQYQLLLSKEISQETLSLCQKENKIWDSYYSSLKLLNKVAKTKKELTIYLSAHDYNEKEIAFAIERLESQGYLDDSSYAKSFVHRQLSTTTKGPLRVKRELAQKGIAIEIIEEVMEEYTAEKELEKLEKIVSKKVQSNHNKSSSLLKRKLVAELSREGFQQEFIKTVCEKFITSTDELNIAKQEYKKIKQRLQKKYTGKELDYKVKQKLYALGFKDYLEMIGIEE